MPIEKTSSESGWRWVMALVAIVMTLGIWFFWPDSKVTLDDDGYQTTLALYRICNQQDADALTDLQQSISRPEQSPTLSAESREWIASIIATAQSGRWKDALIAVRKAMDDQVQR